MTKSITGLMKNLAILICLSTQLLPTSVLAQSPANQPHAVIHFIRSARTRGSRCQVNISLPNQRPFILGNGSLVDYTIYSHGLVPVTLIWECPGEPAEPEQVQLDIIHGHEYYVDADGSGLRSSSRRFWPSPTRCSSIVSRASLRIAPAPCSLKLRRGCNSVSARSSST